MASPHDNHNKRCPVIYEVFARKARGEALRHIGNLNAPDDALAGIYAYNTYDEEKWFDMYVVPRDRFVEVFNVDKGEMITESMS